MVYRVLAELTVLLHFLWILFIFLGVVFALKKSKIAWVHLGGLLFSLFLNIFGWYCPLTYLENYLRRFQGETRHYGGSFINRSLEVVIYPDLSEGVIRIGEILFVCLNLVVYGVLAKKYYSQSDSLEK